MNLLQRERAGLKQVWPRILAVLTCLIMVLLVAQQGGTIATQQSLIHLLWGDSTELFRIRVQAFASQREKARATDPQKAAPEGSVPEDKAPAAQPPAPQAEPAPSTPAPPPEAPKPARVLWRI